VAFSVSVARPEWRRAHGGASFHATAHAAPTRLTRDNEEAASSDTTAISHQCSANNCGFLLVASQLDWRQQRATDGNPDGRGPSDLRAQTDNRSKRRTLKFGKSSGEKRAANKSNCAQSSAIASTPANSCAGGKARLLLTPEYIGTMCWNSKAAKALILFHRLLKEHLSNLKDEFFHSPIENLSAECSFLILWQNFSAMYAVLK
jgi:hypothetical protein